MPPKLIVTECPSKVKRVCRAEGCGAEIRGTDLTLHYKSRVNFKLLKELNIATKERAERMINDVFRVNYTVNDLTNGLVRILANLEPNRMSPISEFPFQKTSMKNYNIF